MGVGAITQKKSILIISLSVFLLFNIPLPSAHAAATVEYLVIGGGGGGDGSGGGAGGYQTATGHAVTVQSYTITVGAGGAKATVNDNAASGGNSIFDTITSDGGGRGKYNTNGVTGGSGSGGGSGGTYTGAAGTGGQGSAGGNSVIGGGGGGGGAGGVGGNGALNTGGTGGIGLSSSISGSSVCRAGGGGGGGSASSATCGGGAGANVGASDGTANTGGGGGGIYSNYPAGNGGSGVVILRYLTGSLTATGGTITTSGSYTIHTFTTSGTFTVTSTATPPDAVTDLTSTAITANTVNLDWTAPSAGGGSQVIIGYQINATTPQTNNPLVFLNDTGTTNTDYLVTGLTFGTDYSFRVSAWTNVTNGHPLNNATGNVYNATTTSTTYTTPPTLTAFGRSSTPTQIDLEFPGSTMQNINGYRIQRETPINTGWSTIVSNTTTTTQYYNNTGLTSNIIYNYRVYAMNSTGISSASNTYAMTTFHLPDAVTDLTGSATDLSTIDLSWSAPASYAPAITGYMINGTTPTGEPVDILNADTGTTATTATALNLLIGQEYSFRVSPITIHGKNATGNIWNGSTIQTFVIGNLSNPDITNDDDFSIFFERTDLNSTAIQLDVTYPNSYNLSCDFSYKYARTNQTYSGLTTVPDGTDDQTATFTLINATGDLVQVRCWDILTGDESKYVITITDFPFLEQIRSLRNGDYGTYFQIGAFDGVMLIIIFLGMVGLNRTTPIVGIIFVVITTLTMSYFELITYPIIMYPALIMMIVWAFVTTRKDD